jgi:predicted MFS family arabinose efflux permease
VVVAWPGGAARLGGMAPRLRRPGLIARAAGELVQGHLRAELDRALAGVVRLITLCAGQGTAAGALLTVTIVAGFASSIFLPLAGLLNQHLGWRHALLALAAIHLVTTVPLHAALLPRDRPLVGGDGHRAVHHTHVRQAITGRGFWLLLTGFAGQGAAVAVIGVLLVTYLTTLGHTPLFAATVAGLLGVLSVTGRLVATGLRRRLPIAAITAVVFVLQAAGAATLPWAGTSTTGAIGCVILIGLGFGVATIARPAILAERYTTNAYASISGAMALRRAIPHGLALLTGRIEAKRWTEKVEHRYEY